MNKLIYRNKNRFNRLVSRFKSKTPAFVKFLQVLSGAITAVALYFNQYPIRWKSAIPDIVIQIISYAGLVLIFFLQFSEKKSK